MLTSNTKHFVTRSHKKKNKNTPRPTSKPDPSKSLAVFWKNPDTAASACQAASAIAANTKVGKPSVMPISDGAADSPIDEAFGVAATPAETVVAREEVQCARHG